MGVIARGNLAQLFGSRLENGDLFLVLVGVEQRDQIFAVSAVMACKPSGAIFMSFSLFQASSATLRYSLTASSLLPRWAMDQARPSCSDQMVGLVLDDLLIQVDGLFEVFAGGVLLAGIVGLLDLEGHGPRLVAEPGACFLLPLENLSGLCLERERHGVTCARLNLA